MQVLDISLNDIDEIKGLQPEGWPDIAPHFIFYTTHAFCRPIKVISHNRIAGIGTAIFHKNSAWLGHIIVHKEFRNQGIGTLITQRLISDINQSKFSTISLIATDMGEPVYKKLGFKKITEYHFYKRVASSCLASSANKIINGSPELYNTILKLDKHSSGENRAALLEQHLEHSKIYLDNGDVTGFYLPTLGEGLIVARDGIAGNELLKYSLSDKQYCVIPQENITAAEFLLSGGFQRVKHGARMSLGQPLGFKPETLFNRIAGNLG